MRFNPYKKFETLKANVDSVIAIKKIMTTGIEDHHFLQNLFELSEALSGIQRGKTQFDWLIADKTMSSLYEEMWRPDPIDLVKLSKLPEGSLGKIFADNLLSEGFDPKELTEIDPYPIKNFRKIPFIFIYFNLQDIRYYSWNIFCNSTTGNMRHTFYIKIV